MQQRGNLAQHTAQPRGDLNPFLCSESSRPSAWTQISKENLHNLHFGWSGVRFGAQQKAQDEIRETELKTLALDSVPEELLGVGGSWSLWTVAQQTLLLKQELIDCFPKEPTVLLFSQKLLESTRDFKTFLITAPVNSSWRPFSVQFSHHRSWTFS